ncbi:MAG: hypothetical protein AB7D57_01830 [Desulfovibrionaceae bacterium]
MRRFLTLLGLLLPLLVSGPAYGGGKPVLTILFTGNTYGTMRPCPS